VRVLVDTHCWLWALARPGALNTETAALLSDGETEVVFSAASVWEIAIKSSLGKLGVSPINGDSLFDIIDSQPLTRLPILHSHARHVASLPRHHGDPFDRLLIAQAQIENLPIMTADDQFLRYEVEVIWAARRKPRRRRK
jgi:PIN domain nuclease of toxin-antitoxin system